MKALTRNLAAPCAVLSFSLVLPVAALAAPDLTIHNLTLYVKIGGMAPGDTLDANTFIRNAGNQPVDQVQVKWYFRYAGGPYPGTLLTTMAIPGTLQPTQIVSRKPTLKIPADAASGQHDICAVADPGNSIAENDEGNNGRCVSLTVKARTVIARLPHARMKTGPDAPARKAPPPEDRLVEQSPDPRRRAGPDSLVRTPSPFKEPKPGPGSLALAMPDLVVRDVGFVRQGPDCLIRVTIANQGAAGVPDSLYLVRRTTAPNPAILSMALTINGKPLGSRPISVWDPFRRLTSPGGSVHYAVPLPPPGNWPSFNFSPDGPLAAPTLYAVVDPANVLKESVETNNERTVKSRCPSA
jgi:hypothetical protein